MRLWSLHTKYLDPKGLVALWREALLAQAVLYGETKGYHNHPQLTRFKDESAPLIAIALYLKAVQIEAEVRGYTFNKNKIKFVPEQPIKISVTNGQMEYEWHHLMAKLKIRSPKFFHQWAAINMPEPHPLFKIIEGPIAPWERINNV